MDNSTYPPDPPGAESTLQDRQEWLWEHDPITACMIDDFAPIAVDILDRLERGDEVDHEELIAFVLVTEDAEQFISADRWARTAAWIVTQAKPKEVTG